MLTSRSRDAARTATRVATFADAITSRQLTAASISSIGSRTSPTIASCSATAVAVCRRFVTGLSRSRASKSAASSARVRASDAAGARRPTTDRILYCRYCSGLIAALGGCVRDRRSGSQMSVAAAGNANPAGITPMTIAAASSTRIVRPTAPGSPPNRRRHNPSLMMATRGAPGTSSAAVNARPARGATPRTSVSVALQSAPTIRSGAPPADDSVTVGLQYAPSAEKVRARSFTSK